MLKYIKGISFCLLLAGSAGAQSIPYFPAGEWPEVPPVDGPVASSGTAVSSFTPVEIPAFAFTGQSDVAAMLETAVRASTVSVEAAVYGFTLPGVADALVDAKKRGVKVRVLVNESHMYTSRRSEELQLLLDQGVELRALRGVGRFGIMHNKIGIFDGKILMCGSFNWAVTANAANSENAVFSRDAGVIGGYLGYFDWMWTLARPIADGPSQPVATYGPPPQDPARPINFNGALLPGYSFSPGGVTEKNIVSALDFARESADIAVFSFYSLDIAKAVINAHRRGLRVRVLVDRVQASQSEVGEMLLAAGVPFRWSQGFAGKGVMHNKYAVLDGRLLMTGSFNWSDNAQDNNFENMFYSASPEYTGPYAAQFERLFSAAEAPTPEELAKAVRAYRSSLK